MNRKGAKKKLTVAEIFCGAGGFSLGFELAGFEAVFAIDNDTDCVATYNGNFGSLAQCDDAARYDFSKIRARVVIGGPPCQPYSQLGKNADVDVRTGLTLAFVRAVRQIKPDVFVVENVPGYLQSKQATYLAETAATLGYTTTKAVLNAKDHGIAQSRDRAFIIGSRLGIAFFPEPTVGDSATVEDAIGDLPGRPTGDNWHTSRTFEKITRQRFRHVPPGGNRLDLPMSLRPPCWQNGHNGSLDVFGRLWWDRASVTIRTEFIKPEKGRYLHPSCNRPLTPREGARLQSFPDSFSFSGSMTSVVRQIGNAVPPRLAYRIALAVRAHLLEGTEGSIADGTRRRSRLVSADSQKVQPPSGYDIVLRARRLKNQ